MIDKHVLKILFKRYWSSTGWTNKPLSKKEFEYSKKAGIMFDDKEAPPHNVIIQQIIELDSKLLLFSI